MKKLFTYFIIIMMLLGIMPSPKVSAENVIEPEMQVKLVNHLGNVTSLSLKINGSFYLEGTSAILNSSKSYSIKVENGGTSSASLSLYDGITKLSSSNQLFIKPVNENDRALINNREYAGSFQFVLENQRYVRPINKIYLDDYLKSVVPAEMYASWSKEALKVQAVAARTYAYMRKDKVIDDTTYYQAYDGTAKYHSNSTAAVEETAGEVLLYNGRLIDAVYSASNGGMTESNANEWGSAPLAYLPVQQDPYDTKINWAVSIKKKQIDTTSLDLSQPNKWWDITTEANKKFADNLRSWLGRNGYSNKQIKIVSIPVLDFYEKMNSGRVDRADLKFQFFIKDKLDSNGKVVLQTAEVNYAYASTIRSLIGSSDMTSTLIMTETETNDAYDLAGKGSGHGVGMSQHGANNRVNAGYKYRDVLAFYYPGTVVSKQYEKHVVKPGFTLIKTNLNGKDFSPGYFGNNTTYVNWNALKVFNIPFTNKGNGVFIIEGRTVTAEEINGEWYIKWSLLSPGKVIYKVIDGGYNFIYFKSVKVQLNGVNFTQGGYFLNSTTYVNWEALKVLKIPYTYIGNGVFTIEGRTVTGEKINGNWYIKWSLLSPKGMTYKVIDGGYNFIYTKPITVQLNGASFAPGGYFLNGTTYVNWESLKVLKIPYTYKGNGVFTIEGRTVTGVQINGNWYIKWSLLSPKGMTYKVIDGGYNFIYTKPINVQLNGMSFAQGGYFLNNTTYVYWEALKVLKIPYTYKGNGVFTIQGRTVTAAQVNGNWYINWSLLAPGKITYKTITGGYNFIYKP